MGRVMSRHSGSSPLAGANATMAAWLRAQNSRHFKRAAFVNACHAGL